MRSGARVNTEQQLIYWEELLKRAEDQYEFLPDAYWREIAPYKHMLRVIRLKLVLAFAGAQQTAWKRLT